DTCAPVALTSGTSETSKRPEPVIDELETKKDIRLSHEYQDRMMGDADAVNFAKEDGMDVNDTFYMSRRERLISEEIRLRDFEDAGTPRAYVYDDDEWQKENELNTEMSIEELSRHVPALDILLTDKVKSDQARRRLKKGYGFSEKQVFALIPKQTAGRKMGGETTAVSYTPDTPDITQEAEPEAVNTCQISQKETIRDLAERIIRDNISEKDVKVIAIALSGTASNASAGLSRLTRLRRELKVLGASEKIISATFIPDTTRSANKIQKERSKQREDEGLHYPDHFSLESVKERLDMYDVSKAPDLQALADVMIMLCIRPAEIKDLRISNGGVTGYAKNRGQQDIPRVFRSLEENEERAKLLLTWIQGAISSGQLRDPGKPGVL
ncbi:hypothetical protein RhiirC2_827007, partial [Rhizophagus irregularis]